MALVAGGLIGSAGCDGPASRPAVRHPYETVGKDPRRNSELAKTCDADARGQIRRGDLVRAERLLKAALDADVTFGPAHNNLGEVYFQQGELYLAAWEFQYASKLMPASPEPENNLGLVWESAGRLDDAVNAFDEAVRLRPDDARFEGNDARARYRRGDRDDRLRGFLEALVLHDSRPAWASWAREQLARIRPGPATRP